MAFTGFVAVIRRAAVIRSNHGIVLSSYVDRTPCRDRNVGVRRGDWRICALCKRTRPARRFFPTSTMLCRSRSNWHARSAQGPQTPGDLHLGREAGGAPARVFPPAGSRPCRRRVEPVALATAQAYVVPERDSLLDQLDRWRLCMPLIAASLAALFGVRRRTNARLRAAHASPAIPCAGVRP